MRSILTLIQTTIAAAIIATTANAGVIQMTPDVAYEKALAGEIILIDIREPGEWADTGLPDVAFKASLQGGKAFVDTVMALRAQSPDTPLAFICRSGNRSGYVTAELTKMGLTDIIDVVEGMGGSSVGEGWIKRGLPIRTSDEPINPAIAFVQP